MLTPSAFYSPRVRTPRAVHSARRAPHTLHPAARTAARVLDDSSVDAVRTPKPAPRDKNKTDGARRRAPLFRFAAEPFQGARFSLILFSDVFLAGPALPASFSADTRPARRAGVGDTRDEQRAAMSAGRTSPRFHPPLLLSTPYLALARRSPSLIPAKLARVASLRHRLPLSGSSSRCQGGPLREMPSLRGGLHESLRPLPRYSTCAYARRRARRRRPLVSPSSPCTPMLIPSRP